jgi:N6-L-threonylcarbamoyladenine synthase
VSDRRLILGIETSCDETAASVVEGGRIVRSNIIASQHDLHAEYKGVVPEIASRAHAERLLPIVRESLAAAGVSYSGLSAVAVGNRPGLIGSLLVGVAAAKALAWSIDKPIVGVDHVHAHLIAGCIGPHGAIPSAPVFPAFGLVVSGGHTSLYLCRSLTSVQRVGATIDDAIGEAYDKVASVLGLDFPGGPNLDKLARTAAPLPTGFPIARISPSSLDFSFSGLKTAALYAFKGVPEDDRTRAKREARGEPPAARHPAPVVAATFQHAAVETILLKLSRARDQHPEARTLLVGGGVSANSLLRERLQSFAAAHELDLRLPRLEYCLDNAAMIAALGHELLSARGWTSDDLAMTATPTSAF